VGLEVHERARTTSVARTGDGGAAQGLYLDLMKKALLNTIYEDGQLTGSKVFEAKKRDVGLDWPSQAHTMIGKKRLDNLQWCVETALHDGVAGDFIETGVWRGGACILMRAVLKAWGVTDRRVFVADSFAGLPPPNAALYPADANDKHHTFAELAVSVEQVKAHFERYDLLDEQVVFLKGWFKDTLPAAPLQKLAVARLDGDMYESTMDAIKVLYPKLSPGGFLIIDDFGAVPACKQAIDDYRNAHGINEPIHQIDWTGAYWRKS
jgi:O-methyltransferase